MFVEIDQNKTLTIKYNLIETQTNLTGELLVDQYNCECNDLLNVLLHLGYIENIVISTKCIQVLFKDSKDLNCNTKQNEIKTIINNYLTNVGEININTLDNSNSIDTSIYSNEILESDSEIIKRIKGIISQYIEPTIEADGGFIKFVNYENDIVTIYMGGSCNGCPSKGSSLENIINVFKFFIKTIIDVKLLN